jgi:hypothetical protein
MSGSNQPPLVLYCYTGVMGYLHGLCEQFMCQMNRHTFRVEFGGQ